MSTINCFRHHSSYHHSTITSTNDGIDVDGSLSASSNDEEELPTTHLINTAPPIAASSSAIAETLEPLVDVKSRLTKTTFK
jgi:hypothetical protein